MTCRFGVATGCNVNVPVAATLDVFASAGVTAVEVGTPPRHFDPWCHEQITDLGRRLHRLGIIPVSIHAPFGGPLDLSDPNPQGRHAAIGAGLIAASAMRHLGGSRVIVHTTDVVRDGQNVGERLGHCAASLDALARACSHMGAMLVVETPLPHLIGGQPDEFDWILSKLDGSVGVCIDTGHVSLGGHWDRFVGVAGRRLVHVHANDNRGQFDDHLTPGDGSIDWPHIRETLARAEFDGWIVLELSSPDGPAPEHIATALHRVRDLLS